MFSLLNIGVIVFSMSLCRFTNTKKDLITRIYVIKVSLFHYDTDEIHRIDDVVNAGAQVTPFYVKFNINDDYKFCQSLFYYLENFKITEAGHMRPASVVCISL